MRFTKSLVPAVVLAAVSVTGQFYTAPVMAQEAAKSDAEAKKPSTKKRATPPMPEKHKGRKTQAMGQSVGKKVTQAYDLYADETLPEKQRVDDALTILKDIEAKGAYDQAYVDRFIGSLMAGLDGQAKGALVYLKKAVAADILSYNDHSGTMRLVADLQMQERLYKDAIPSYEAWMDFTENYDPNVYVRIAQAQYETKQYADVVVSADKALAQSDEPVKNALILKVSSFYERKLYPDAISIAEQLVVAFPEDKQWWIQTGMFYMLVEDYKKALSILDLSYKQGYLEKPAQAKALTQLFATNDVPYKAAVLTEKFMDEGLMKKDAAGYKALANNWHAALNLAKAAKYYGQAAEELKDPDLFRKQGSLLLQSEKYSQSVAPLKKALDLGHEKKGSIHMNLAEAYYYQEQYKSALKHVNLAKNDPSTKRVARSWTSYIKDTAARKGKSI